MHEIPWTKSNIIVKYLNFFILLTCFCVLQEAQLWQLIPKQLYISQLSQQWFQHQDHCLGCILETGLVIIEKTSIAKKSETNVYF